MEDTIKCAVKFERKSSDSVQESKETLKWGRSFSFISYEYHFICVYVAHKTVKKSENLNA